jgi:hypothetical protein
MKLRQTQMARFTDVPVSPWAHKPTPTLGFPMEAFLF